MNKENIENPYVTNNNLYITNIMPKSLIIKVGNSSIYITENNIEFKGFETTNDAAKAFIEECKKLLKK